MSDWNAQARALSENEAQVWKPEAGDALAGRVRSWETGVGQNKDSQFVEITDQAGDRHGVWLSTILAREFEKLNVQVGDVVAIKYLGLKKAQKSGREFKSFNLEVLERKPVGGDGFKDDLLSVV